MVTTQHGAPVLTDDASREEILEALKLCAAYAARTMSKDSLGRPNGAWAARHRYINSLLDKLDACGSP